MGPYFHTVSGIIPFQVMERVCFISHLGWHCPATYFSYCLNLHFVAFKISISLPYNFFFLSTISSSIEAHLHRCTRASHLIFFFQRSRYCRKLQQCSVVGNDHVLRCATQKTAGWLAVVTFIPAVWSVLIPKLSKAYNQYRHTFYCDPFLRSFYCPALTGSFSSM